MFLLYIFLNFGTILMDGKKNNIIILQHQSLDDFLQSIQEFKVGTSFVLNLKQWYLSKMIPFLKCPLVPTFLLLIKARRCDQKTEMFSLKEPFTWEFLVIFFCMPVCIFNSDIWKENRRSHVKLYIILFFKKEKMKWNEMRMKPCVE